MGFSKKKVRTTIPVSFLMNIIDEKNDTTTTTSVTHVFHRPTIKERELYRQTVHQFEGGRSRIRLTKANLLLWDACIQSVSGYDDLPAENWKDYFLGDDIGKEHADAAVRFLLDKITEQEEDLEKNSDL